ncbi:Hypothetical protein A7982_03473 [Minicystis rosea]|nr:Hypothetical protein A7982_03473 [Minicystis rosea]
MGTSSDKTMRFVLVAFATMGAGMVLPAACLFPDYTFDLNGTGGTGSTSSSTGSTTTSSSSTTSSSTGSTTTSSSTSSTSSSSGAACDTADCSDPNCQSTYACVAPAPSGWQGPYALYDGAPANFQGCPSQFPEEAYAGNGEFSAQPATCSTCSCGGATGQVCTFGAMQVEDTACGGNNTCLGTQSVPASWNGACYYNSDGYQGGANAKTCGPQTPPTTRPAIRGPKTATNRSPWISSR